MGDINQTIYLQKFLPAVDGPVLEIGSKDYGNTSSFRNVYTQNEYVGIDMEDGKNVDHVVDLVAGVGPLKERHFGLAICCSVLEHVTRPWVMAENITRLIRPGGVLYMSVPWVWRYHPYPDDYYRFSFKGIKELFPGFAWDQIYYSSTVPGEFFPLTEENLGIDNQLAMAAETPQGKRKYLPYLMVNMLGTRLG